MVQYGNILVIQTAFIGDAILASSLLETLHLNYPSANISILVRQGNEMVYNHHPFLKEVLVWNKTQKKIRNLFSLLGLIRKRRFDCVINCHRFASSGILTAFSGARHTAGYKQNPLSFLFNTTVKHSLQEGKHEVERYYQLIEDFVTVPLQEPKLYPSLGDYQKITDCTAATYVCIAPASVWFTKQWPKHKWVSLCDALAPTIKIYLLGAPSDRLLCEEISKETAHGQVINLAGQLNLLQSAALMKSAKMNYVNDSAPLHLATSMQAPVTAIFCSTIPAFGFGPRGANATVAQVEQLSCRPCGIHGHKKCPQQHFNCANNISLNSLPL